MSVFTKVKGYIFKKDHILYKVNNNINGKSIFYLKSGKAQVKFDLGKRKSYVMTCSSGSLFGIFETMSNLTKRISEVKFLEKSIVYLWTKEEFIMDVSINQELGMKTIVYLSSILRKLNQKIQEIG